MSTPQARERERFPASSFSFKPWEIHISIRKFVISVGFHICFWLNEIKIIWPDNCNPDVCLYIVYPKIQEDLRVNPTTCPCRSRQITIFWMNLIQPGSRAPQNPSWIVEVEPLHQFANWFFKSLRIDRFLFKTRSATNDSSKSFWEGTLAGMPCQYDNLDYKLQLLSIRLESVTLGRDHGESYHVAHFLGKKSQIQTVVFSQKKILQKFQVFFWWVLETSRQLLQKTPKKTTFFKLKLFFGSTFRIKTPVGNQP